VRVGRREIVASVAAARAVRAARHAAARAVTRVVGHARIRAAERIRSHRRGAVATRTAAVVSVVRLASATAADLAHAARDSASAAVGFVRHRVVASHRTWRTTARLSRRLHRAVDRAACALRR
jgi:hypothetical protein